MHHRYFWVMQYRKKQIQRINILQNLLFFLYCFSVIFEFSVSCKPFSKSWKRTFFVPAHEITKNAICMFYLFHKTQFLWNKRSSGIFIPERLSQTRYFQNIRNTRSFFFHPDYTVGFGIAPNHALRLVGFTTGGDSHPALKTLCFLQGVLWHISIGKSSYFIHFAQESAHILT